MIDVDKDGDAVVNVAGHRWLFHAAALVLESKEEERQPPGVRTENVHSQSHSSLVN